MQVDYNLYQLGQNQFDQNRMDTSNDGMSFHDKANQLHYINRHSNDPNNNFQSFNINSHPQNKDLYNEQFNQMYKMPIQRSSSTYNSQHQNFKFHPNQSDRSQSQNYPYQEQQNKYIQNNQNSRHLLENQKFQNGTTDQMKKNQLQTQHEDAQQYNENRSQFKRVIENEEIQFKKIRSASVQKNEKSITVKNQHNRLNSQDQNSKFKKNQQLQKKSQFVCPVPYNEVYVWGTNINGQLGLGEIDFENQDSQSDSQNKFSQRPKICCFNVIVKKVSCGMSHTIMLSSTGHVYSMGSNQHGQLGLNAPTFEINQNGQESILSKQLPCLVEALSKFIIIDIASGNDHCLALSEERSKLFSWGQGKFGALGKSKSQNLKEPNQIILKKGQKIQQIAAGSRHSAYILSQSQDLFTFGLALHGQLGLGEECTDRAFLPEKVQLGGIKVKQVALGDTHSLIITENGSLMSTGANDKYQLGMDPEKRNLKFFNFKKLTKFNSGDKNDQNLQIRDIIFKKIECWNLNAAIDEQDRVYLWGILHDKTVKQSLCIKVPERVNSFKVQEVAIGPTMALIIEKETSQPCVIGVNAKGELGLGDKEQRKTFCIQQDLKEKKIKQVGIGKSGFVVALSEQVIQPEENSNSSQQVSKSLQKNRNFNEKQVKMDQQKYQIANEFQSFCGEENDQTVLIDKIEQISQNNNLGNKYDNEKSSYKNLNEKIIKLENDLQLKQKIISESVNQHSHLLEKINQLEHKLEHLDQKQKIEKVVQESEFVPNYKEFKQVSYYQAHSEKGKSRRDISIEKEKNEKICEKMSEKNSNRNIIQSNHSNNQLSLRSNAPLYKLKQENHNKSDTDNLSKANTESAAPDIIYQQENYEFQENDCNVKLQTFCDRNMTRQEYNQMQEEQEQVRNMNRKVGSNRSGSPIVPYYGDTNFNDVRSQNTYKQYDRKQNNLEYNQFNQNHKDLHNYKNLSNSENEGTIQMKIDTTNKNTIRDLKESKDIQDSHQFYQQNISQLQINREHIQGRPSYIAINSLTSDQEEQRNSHASPYENAHSQNMYRQADGSSSLVSRPQIINQNEFQEFRNLDASSIQQNAFYEQQINELRSQIRQKEVSEFDLKQQCIKLDGENKNLKMNYLSKEQENQCLNQKINILEEENQQQKIDLLKQEKDQKEYQGRIESLTQKLDSLVKFLEEERTLRKQAEYDIQQKQKQIQEQNKNQYQLEEQLNTKSDEIFELQTIIGKQKESIEEQIRQKQQIQEDKTEMHHQVIDLESRLRSLQKQYEEKQQDFERQLKEKYDIQTKHFLLQQEMNQNNNQQIQILANQNKDGIEVQKKMLEASTHFQNLNQKNLNIDQVKQYQEQNMIQNLHNLSSVGQTVRNLATIDSQNKDKIEYSPQILRDQKFNDYKTAKEQRLNPTIDKKIQNSFIETTEYKTSQNQQIQSYQETSQQSGQNTNQYVTSEKQQPSLKLHQKNKPSIDSNGKEPSEFPYRNYKEYIYDWMKKKVGQDDEKEQYQTQNQNFENKKSIPQYNQSSRMQNLKETISQRQASNRFDKNTSLYAITSSGLLSKQYDTRDEQQDGSNSFDSQQKCKQDILMQQQENNFKNESFKQQGRREDIKKPQWLKEYSEQKDQQSISLRHDQIRSYDKDFNHFSQNHFQNDRQPSYQNNQKQVQEGQTFSNENPNIQKQLNPKYFLSNQCLSESQNSMQFQRLSMNKEGQKMIDFGNQNSTIHDNLEAHTISSNTLHSPVKSVASSPIQNKWASKVFQDSKNKELFNLNNNNNNTFRTRIENLLPDRLKNQYQIQQKNFGQQNQY